MKRSRRPFQSSLLALGLLALLAGPAAATFEPSSWDAETPEQPEVLLVRGATVWTSGPQGVLENADLLIRRGKVARIGQGLDAPSGAIVIDAAGKHVTPGLIDCHSHSAIDGAVNEGTNIITAEVRIADVIDPTSISIYRQLAGGLTTANLLHGSANSIGGQNAVIKLRWGAGPEELRLEGAPEGIKFALGENPKQSNWGGNSGTRYPQTRPGVEQSIRSAFLAARDYQRRWQEHERSGAADSVPPRRDLQLEALVEILEGERLVHSHSYRADEILMLLRVAEELGFKISSFQHVLEGYKVADELAAHGAGASTFSDWWAYKYEVVDAIPHNGTLMTDRGVVVSFNSDDSELARRLNLEAAKAVRYGGVAQDEALKLVTLNPAIQLGIEDQVGSLEPGKDADFVLWSGHPLSTYSRAEQTWVDGERQFDRQADLAAREEVEAKRAELIERIRNGDKKKDDADQSDEDASDDERSDDDTESEADESTPEANPQPDPRPLEYRDRLAKSPAAEAATALTGATVHPVSGPAVEGGVVIVEDGKVTAVGGPQTAIPAGAEVVDLAGKHLYPGFIQPTSTLGLIEINSVRGTDDRTELAGVNAHHRAEVAFNADSLHLPVAVSGGVLTAHVVPGGGSFSGTSAVMRLEGWNWEQMAMAAPAGMNLHFPGASADDEEDGASNRGLSAINDTLDDARAYAKARQAGASGLDVDPRLEALQPLLDGEMRLFLHAGEKRQIEQALDWAAEQGFEDVVLVTGSDAAHLAERLASDQVEVILNRVLAEPDRRWEPYDSAFTAPARLQEAGVRFAIGNGGDASDARNLPFQAAMAAAFGLTPEQALRSVTLSAAEILGVADRLGSIDEGKEATLIVTDGDPLEIRTRIERAWIRGQEVDLSEDHQRRLYDKYRQRPLP